MADREMIAATLAAGILSRNDVPYNEDGARIAAEFYQQVLAAVVKVDVVAHRATFRRPT